MRVVWGLGLIVLLIVVLGGAYLITDCWHDGGYWAWTGCMGRG